MKWYITLMSSNNGCFMSIMWWQKSLRSVIQGLWSVNCRWDWIFSSTLISCSHQILPSRTTGTWDSFRSERNHEKTQASSSSWTRESAENSENQTESCAFCSESYEWWERKRMRENAWVVEDFCIVWPFLLSNIRCQICQITAFKHACVTSNSICTENSLWNSLNNVFIE